MFRRDGRGFERRREGGRRAARSGADGAKKQQVAERALVHGVEAGLVAVQQGERARAGKRTECAGYAVERFGGALLSYGLVHQASFDGPGAAEAPVRRSHLLDHPKLDAVGGLKAFEVLIEEGAKAFRGFVFKNNGAGQQSVANRVA